METDGDYALKFTGDRQVELAHFYAIDWTEDTRAPIKFAFGYWSHDGVFCQGFVDYSAADGFGPARIKDWCLPTATADR